MIKVMLLMLIFSCAGCHSSYRYVDDLALRHCKDDCPSQKCLCILGSNNTWYLNPEIGE